MHFHLLSILGVITCIHLGQTQNFDLIGKFAKKMFPGKCLSGLLCWKTEKIIKLSAKLHFEGVYYSSLRETSELQNNLILVDISCDNRLKREKQKYIRNVLFLGTSSCEEVPDWSFNAPLVNVYVFGKNNTRAVKCTKRELKSSWKSQIIAFWDDSEQNFRNVPNGEVSMLNEESQPIEVVFVASSETALNIKDFRRNLDTEATARFNYQLFSEVFNFLNLTPAESFAQNVNFLQKISSTSKELIAHPLRVDRENFTIYDFITSRTPNRRAFLLRAPSLSAVSNVFTLPLELNVWYASYALLAIILVTIFCIVKVEWRFPDMVSNKYRIMYPRMVDVVHLHISAIAQQGSEAEPISGGGRIATFLVFLFILFLYTAYLANIVALLGGTTKRIHGVTDLKDFNVKLGVDKADFSRDIFKEQDSMDHQELFREKLAKDECYMSLDEGINRIRSEFFAFHGNSDKIYKMIDKLYADNEKCGFVEIPYLTEPHLLIAIRKDSTVKEIIKIGLALFFERGMHHRVKSIIFAKQPQCYAGGTNFVTVSLLDCYFAFVIYSGGTAMSILIFLVEILVSRNRVSRKVDQIEGELQMQKSVIDP